MRSGQNEKLMKMNSDCFPFEKSSESAKSSAARLLSRENYQIKIDNASQRSRKSEKNDYQEGILLFLFYLEISKRLSSLKNLGINQSNFCQSIVSDADEIFSPMIAHERSDYEH